MEILHNGGKSRRLHSENDINRYYFAFILPSTKIFYQHDDLSVCFQPWIRNTTQVHELESISLPSTTDLPWQHRCHLVVKGYQRSRVFNRYPNSCSVFQLIRLSISGDISLNPGPKTNRNKLKNRTHMLTLSDTCLNSFVTDLKIKTKSQHLISTNLIERQSRSTESVFMFATIIRCRYLAIYRASRKTVAPTLNQNASQKLEINSDSYHIQATQYPRILSRQQFNAKANRCTASGQTYLHTRRCKLQHAKSRSTRTEQPLPFFQLITDSNQNNSHNRMLQDPDQCDYGINPQKVIETDVMSSLISDHELP